MNALDFKVFLERDEDYGVYVVRCPSLLFAGENSWRGSREHSRGHWAHPWGYEEPWRSRARPQQCFDRQRSRGAM